MREARDRPRDRGEGVGELCCASVLMCFFCAGQTGSGKTFTMEGARGEGDEKMGINPRALRHLFDLISERKQLSAMSSEAEDGWSYEVAAGSHTFLHSLPHHTPTTGP